MNNYAISSDGIATALQDSASALMAAGNNLEQSVALVAAANKVVQDPNSVGSALRTISLRLRGTSVQVLEEMGEETDGVVTSLSKMQSKIKALSGVDILTDSGEYKDTYTILKEIGTVWEDMSDIDQAALLELMAGKNRANTLAAILSNMEDLEDAYKDAQNAEGSALRENEAYLDSIQGRIDLFTNAVQTMWMNLISSDLVKGIVDMGTALIQTLDKIGVVGTTVFTTLAAFLVKNKINLTDLVSEFANWGKLFATGLNISSFTDKVDLTQGGMFQYIKQMFNSTDLSKEAGQFWQSLFDMDDAHTDSALWLQAQLDSALASGKITAATYAEIVAKEGLVATNLTLTQSLEVLWGSMVKFFTTTPVGQVMLVAGVVAAIAGLIKLYDKFGPTHNHFLEQLEEETKEFKEAQSELEELNSELKTTKERIEELQSKGTLSFVEQEELEKLKQQTAKLERQEKIYEARAKRERQDQIEVAQKAVETDPNFRDNTTEYYVPQGMAYGAALQTRNTLNPDGKNAIERNLEALASAKDNEDKALKEMESALTELDNAEKKLKETTYTKGTYEYQQLEDNFNQAKSAYEKANELYKQAQTRISQYSSNIDSNIDDFETKYGEIGYIEDPTTEAEKWWNEFYNQVQDYQDQQALLNGDILKSDVMDRVFGDTGTEKAQDFKEAFDKEIQAGRSPDVAIANVLENAEFSSFADDLLTKFGISLEEIKGYFTQVGESIVAGLDSIDAYSVIAESVTNYNDVVKQTSEFIVDNTKVTQEYKDSLLALGISESELGECFDENNKLIVKDADALNKLIKSTKNNVAQNVKLAKTQAQLQYQSLANKMRVNVAWMAAQAGSYSIVSQAVEENISMLEEQMEAMDQLIQKYALLELSMTNAGKAYTDYELAKERDAELTYDDSFLEMLKTIDEGLLKNETGTEAFEYAVKAVLSPEAYADMEALDDVNEKIKFIHDYVDGDPLLSRWFYVDEESGELDITADNVRAFVNDGLKKNKEGKSVFTGDATDFDLSDDVNGIEDVAEILGVSEAAALAMLTALEKVDAKWGDILTEVSMSAEERKIHSATKEIAELNKQFAEGKISAEEYAKRVAPHEQKIDNFVQTTKDKLLGSDKGTEDTSDDTLGFIELDKQATAAKKELDESIQELTDAQKKYNEAKDNEETSDEELQKYASEVEEATKKVNEHTNTWQALIDKRGEYPSEYAIQFVISDIDQEIEAYGTKFTKVLEENFKKDSDGYYVPISAEVNIDELEKTYPGIKNYINLLNSKTEIEAFANTTSAEEDAQKLKETVGNIIEAIEANLITLELDETAVNNIVTQANKILSGIISTLGVSIVASMPSWMQSILGWMGFDTGNEQQTSVVSNASNAPSSSAIGGRGQARALGDNGLTTSEHNAVVGELGPEMVVDPIKGTYYTVGDYGTEMIDLPKGAIIYNHKQTEELLKNGHTSRGKYMGGLAFARGNAYATHGIPSYHPNLEDKTSFANSTAVNTKWDDAIRDLSNAADNISSAASDASDEFKEVFDWVEVRLEEIEEQLNLLNAQLENAVGYKEQNAIIDATIDVNGIKLNNLKAGLQEYSNYAAKLLAKIPAQYQAAAQNGAIAIEEFAGEADEITLEAINNYREWAQKVADLTQQIEELETEIADLAKQKFDNVTAQFENEVSLIEAANDKLDAQISLMEDRGYVAAKEYYEAMTENTEDRQAALEKERDVLQSVLDEEVKAGRIKVGSDAWYEMVQQLYDVDAAIVECTSDLESFQNAINDIYWDNFDELISRYDYLSDETQNLIDLMDEADMVTKPDNEDGWSADEVEWTDEGIASLGLYAQQMEIAEIKSRQYAKAIEDLNKDYKDGKYSESEYLEKLDELKSAQYDSIEAYYDAQDAIKDLNETRIDSIKEGIEKEIEAYEKLIEKQKEELDAEKDLHDFQASIMDQQKNITDIERQLAAISNDTSISAAAKRKQLEAELAEAQYELEEMYYDRSVEDKQTALDKELESFQEEKEAEIQKWEEYLENVEQVVADSLGLIQANASGIYDTLSGKADEYHLTLSEAIMIPWTDGALAISDYQEVFDTAASSTMDQLEKIKLKWQEIIDVMSKKAEIEIATQEKTNNRYVSATASTTKVTTSASTAKSSSTAKSTPSVGQTVKVKSTATHFSSQSGNARMASFVPGGTYQVMQVGINGDKSQILIGKNGQYTGWVKLTALEGYAKGTTGVSEDQIAWLDELGEELVMHADGNGRLSFMTKGSSVIPADITKNLMQLGQLNTQDLLDRSRPVMSAPHITNNNIELTMEIAEVVHIDTVTNETMPNLTKAIDKQLDKYMKNLNNQVRKYSR